MNVLCLFMFFISFHVFFVYHNTFYSYSLPGYLLTEFTEIHITYQITTDHAMNAQAVNSLLKMI